MKHSTCITASTLGCIAALAAGSMAVLAAGCVDAGRDRLQIPLSVRGTDASDVQVEPGVRVELDRAELAFGPLYLCAGPTAGALCDTALVEWLDAVVIDTLDTSPVEVGLLQGVSGTARSFMYDHGITSLLTREAPIALPAISTLQDQSLLMQGTAHVDGTAIPFSLELRIQQGSQTEQGVPVVRSAARDRFAHRLREGDRLEVRFDPTDWLQTASFRSWLQDETCSPESSDTLCEGQLEHRCAPDGNTLASRDCQAEGLVCIANQGCLDVLEVDPDSQVAAAVRIDLTSGSAPAFSWSR